jgi:hypothetical protein
VVDFFQHKDGDGTFRILTSCRLAADESVIPRGERE